MKYMTDEEVERLQAIMNAIPDYFTDPEDIQCPSCGEKQSFDSSDSEIYSESSWDSKCDECGKTFSICGSTSWIWFTEKGEE
ncbi:hypothetical protein [Streptomyces cinereoruber]|uniref:hypothetical protein n=1 Tax=Streptomyces cinereoruber TaxID=67260 RepID=UPI00362C352C